MKAFIFPGQGSQAKGMGGDLFDSFSELVDKADDVLGYSIKELCLNDPEGKLNQTQFTQPALYVVNALSYLKRIEELGTKPDFVAGHSLGEFNALFAAGAFDFKAGLKLVKKRGRLMSEATGGGMAAILNMSEDDIRQILSENDLDNIDVANYNTPTQIVISGLKEEVVKAEALFRDKKAPFFLLKTSGAFHSRYMQPSRKKFENYLKKFQFSPLTIPVVANVSGLPYTDDTIHENLSSQLSESVQWAKSVQYIMAQGDVDFEELGHGNVLTKLVRDIGKATDKAVLEQIKQSQDDEQALANESLQEDSVEQFTVVEQSNEESTVESVVASDTSEGNNSVDGDSIDSNDIDSNNIDSNNVDVAPAADTSGANKVTERELTAQDKVNRWNAKYPKGTRVRSQIVDDEDLKTRTEACVLFGHRAAVYLEGYNGYFDLDELAAEDEVAVV